MCLECLAWPALSIPSSRAWPELLCRGVSDFLLCYARTFLGIAIPSPAFSIINQVTFSQIVRVRGQRPRKQETLALTIIRLITALSSLIPVAFAGSGVGIHYFPSLWASGWYVPYSTPATSAFQTSIRFLQSSSSWKIRHHYSILNICK